MSDAADLIHCLAEPRAQVTEQLLAHSARARFDDLAAVAKVIGLLEGTARETQAFAELLASLRADDPGRDSRLRSPVLRGWLHDFGRIADLSDLSDPHLLRQLDHIDNMRVSLDDEGDWVALLAVEQGVVATWDCRRAILGVPGTLVGARKAGDRLTLIDEDGAHHVYDLGDDADPRIRAAPALPGTDIVVRNDLPRLRLTLREGAVPTRAGGIAPWSLDGRDPYYARQDFGPLLAAAAVLEQAWPEKYDDLARTVQVLVPRAAPPGWEVDGFTVSSHQGACWIFSQGLVKSLETLVHEQGHVKLRYVEEAIPILTPDQPEGLFEVSWREDPRPIVGIVEGVFVHLQVAQALRRAAEHGLLDAADTAEARLRAADLAEEVAEALPILRAHARLTEAGQGFLAYAEAAVARERAALVPA